MIRAADHLPKQPPPVDWSTQRLGDLVDLVNGHPFSSEDFAPDGDVPLVRIRDLAAHEFEVFVPRPSVPPRALLARGDVVIGMDGDFNVLIWNREPAALNQRLCRLRPRAGTDHRFIAYALPALLKVVNDLTFSTTVKHLSSSDILGQRLPLPSLDEQRRIADFLDAQTARAARLVGLRERQISQVEDRLQAELDSLFTAPGLPVTRLKFLLRQRISYGVLVPRFVNDGGTRLIRVNDLVDLRQRAASLVQVDAAQSAEYRRTLVAPGDLLVSVVGTVGRAAVVPTEAAGANLARAVARLCPVSEVPTDLLWSWMQSAGFRRQVDLATGGDTAQPTLNVGHLANFELRIPSDSRARIDLTCQAVRAVRFRDAVVAACRTQAERIAERRRALITAAVTGQLDVTTARGRA